MVHFQNDTARGLKKVDWSSNAFDFICDVIVKVQDLVIENFA